MGKVINGFIVFIANIIFMIPSAILTIEFLDILMRTKKDDIIEKAVVKCESKIDKARKKNFNKELKSIFSKENMQNKYNTFTKYYTNNENTFIKYYNINGSFYGSNSSLNSNGNDKPTNVLDLFKLKKNNNSSGQMLNNNNSNSGSNINNNSSSNNNNHKSNNSIGYPMDKSFKSNSSIDRRLERNYRSNESLNYIKPVPYHHENCKPLNSNMLTESIKHIKSNSTDDSIIIKNDKILKSSEMLLNDPTTTLKYGLGDKLLSKKSDNPDILQLNKIIKRQQYLNRITTQADNNRRSMNINGSNDSYSSIESGKNRKNEKGEIAVELKIGQVKYMSVREISKELYNLSMEYYAQCDNEFSDVDEQSGTLYLLMKGFEKTIHSIRKIRVKQS